MTLREIIKYIIPYGLENDMRHYRDKKNGHLLVDAYLEYLRNNGDTKLKEEPSRYKSIIAVQGFGNSGSSAVLDFLREMRNIQVFGDVEKIASVAEDDEYSYEVTFPHLSGGLFDIEKYIDSSNIFHNDSVINRFVSIMEHSLMYRNSPEVRPAVFKFLTQITNFMLPNLEQKYYNAALSPITEKGSTIFTMKHFDRESYRTLCRHFLNELFNAFNLPKETEHIALDQFFCDLEFDMERYLEYLPNIKVIVVYRDPRDIYAFSKMRNVEWIPHTDVETFVEWIRLSTEKFNLHSHEYLPVRYEDFVLDYEKEKNRVTDFLGINSENHVHKRKAFDPDVSKRLVGLWKQHPEDNEKYKFIYDNLKEYCYETST